MSLKIGLDIDDTIVAWYSQYLDKFRLPKNDYEVTRNVYKLRKNKEFWMSLPVINRPDFIPTLYCTKRIHSKEWSKKFLSNNNLPPAPIYQVYCQRSSKASRIKGRVDVFIDDSISNFIDLNLNGVPCLLINTEYNQKWGPIGRVYSLLEKDIEDCYTLFLHTAYSHFKELVNGYIKELS